MRIVRFKSAGSVHFGVLDGEEIRALAGDNPFGLVEGEARFAAADVELLSPVVPGKIIGIGRNYADHARELGNDAPAEPLIFLKASSTLNHPDAVIELPSISQRVDFEGELAVVIGRKARHVTRDDWKSVVFGYCCSNDVTARDLQKKDGQFTRGKSFDSFCPIGPFIETELDVTDLALRTSVNGEVHQNGRTSDMIFAVPQLIEYITAVMTLFPGDIILTGTPAGVGPLVPGDEVVVEIEHLGSLRNRVVAAVVPGSIRS